MESNDFFSAEKGPCKSPLQFLLPPSLSNINVGVVNFLYCQCILGKPVGFQCNNVNMLFFLSPRTFKPTWNTSHCVWQEMKELNKKPEKRYASWLNARKYFGVQTNCKSESRHEAVPLSSVERIVHTHLISIKYNLKKTKQDALNFLIFCLVLEILVEVLKRAN